MIWIILLTNSRHVLWIVCISCNCAMARSDYSYSGQHFGPDTQSSPRWVNENKSYKEKQSANQKAAFQNPAMLLDESDEMCPHGKLSFDLDAFSSRNKQNIYTISTEGKPAKVSESKRKQETLPTKTGKWKKENDWLSLSYRGAQGKSPGPKFLHFHAVFGENWLNNRFTPP